MIRESIRRDRVLWLVLAAAAALRFWRIGGDLPYVLHYDEPTLVDNAVWMIQGRTLDPHFLNYPTGLIYLLALLYGIVLLGGVAFGRFDGIAGGIAWLSAGTYPRPAEGGVLYFYPTIGVPALYLIGRGVSALAGVATVALVYTLARRVAGSRAIARLAAVALALSPLAVENSRLITTDATATALATGCLLAIVTLTERGTRRRDWIVAGALAGLAAGVKYNAGLVAVPLAGVAVRDALRRRGPGEAAAAGRRLALAAAAALVAFLILTPYALLDAARFTKDLGYEFRRVSSITATFQGAEAVEATPIEKVAEIARNGLGIPGILAAVWGAVLAIRSRRAAALVIAGWVAVALLPMLRWQSLYARYLLPPWPAILLLASWGTVDASARAARAARLDRSAAGRAALLAVAVAAFLLPGTIRASRYLAARAHPDPRVVMTRWIGERIPPGEPIVMEPGGPFPDAEEHSIQRVDFLGRSTPGEYRARGIRWLVGTGRESRIAGKPGFGEVLANLDSLRAAADLAWSRGRYAVYRLRGGAAWEDSVSAALAARDSTAAWNLLETALRSGRTLSAQSWKRLALLRAAAGSSAAAQEAWLAAARLDPKDVEPPLALGNLALARGEYASALERFEQARALSPRDPLILHNLAVAHLYIAQAERAARDAAAARASWEEARELADRAATVSPGDPSMAALRDQVLRMGRKWGFLLDSPVDR